MESHVVPDSFVILDVKFCHDRILVAACVEHEVTSPHGHADNEFRSEFWQFAAPDATSDVITFADRKVLLSRTSTFGESMTTYAFSINCAEATAVYDAGWEWGTVRVFDHTGAALPDIREAVAGACGCNPEYTRPIVWTGLDRKPAADPRGDRWRPGPLLRAVRSSVGRGHVSQADEITGRLLDHMLDSVMGQWQ